MNFIIDNLSSIKHLEYTNLLSLQKKICNKCYIGWGVRHRQNVTFLKVVLNPFHKYDWMWDVGISSYTLKNKVRDREEATDES